MMNKAELEASIQERRAALARTTAALAEEVAATLSVRNQVQRHPRGAMLVAAGGGLLLAWAFRHRRRPAPPMYAPPGAYPVPYRPGIGSTLISAVAAMAWPAVQTALKHYTDTTMRTWLEPH